MKNNYLLVHGSFGSPFSNWIPYLRGKIENKNLVSNDYDYLKISQSFSNDLVWLSLTI